MTLSELRDELARTRPARDTGNLDSGSADPVEAQPSMPCEDLRGGCVSCPNGCRWPERVDQAHLYTTTPVVVILGSSTFGADQVIARGAPAVASTGANAQPLCAADDTYDEGVPQ